MTDPIKLLRLGDRTVWIVRRADIESWSRERATHVLSDVAREWPGRDSLLRLSDELLGPDAAVDAAVAFLADAIDRGVLLAVRLTDDAAGLSGGSASADAWDDVPRLSDLGTDPRAVRPPTRDPSPPGNRDPVDVTDPAATFVAFAVFDQHGKPLHGRAESSIDSNRRTHALDGSTIEIRPIAPHARIELALADLEAPPPEDRV